MVHSSLLSNYCIHHPLAALIRNHFTVTSCGKTLRRAIDLNPDDVIDRARSSATRQSSATLEPSAMH
eukprot:scaffold1562_cov93-Skeletonema_dohrnii-CCMP3373.AAC.5